MKAILFSLRQVFLAYSPKRSLIEALLKYDFKIDEARVNLMQLCFSNLASWPLIPALLLIYFDPFKNMWSLIKVLSFENPLVLFLLNGHFINMLLFFLIFYIIEWVIRNEYILLAAVFYFLNRGELHIHLATAAVLAIYFSRLSYLYWLSVDSRSETKKIWKTISTLQLLAWGFVAFTALSALDYIQINFLFNEAFAMSRFNFLAVTVLLYHVFSHLFLSLWGHFYLQKQQEPSNLPIYYSTARWIQRFKISRNLQSLLSAQITRQLEKHLQNQVLFQELKQQSPGLVKFSVEQVLATEISYLMVAENSL